MMNIINNNNANQGQAMDYFVGDWTKDELIGLLNLAKKYNINYQNIGENYLFESNYNGDLVDVIGDNGEKLLNDKNYKAILVITEEIYGRGGYQTKYGFLLTNDDKKIKKFKAYAQAKKLSDENGLKLNTQDLENKIFPGHNEHREMALDGMYLGQNKKKLLRRN